MNYDEIKSKKIVINDNKGSLFINPLELKIKEMMERFMGFTFPPINRN